MNIVQELLFLLKARDDASSVVSTAKDNINQATDAVKKGGDAADAAEKKVSNWTKAKGMAGTAAKVFGGILGGTVIGFLNDASRAAVEDAANTDRLRQTIETSGVAYEDIAPKIDAAIAKGQALAFSDDQTRDSIAQLTQATGDASKAIELQGLVQDVARGKHISLAAATDLVQKAALGQYGALKRVGIVIDENATAEEALGALQSKFAGQGEAYGQQTEAWVFRVRDSIGEWVEGVGAAMGPAQGLLSLLPGMSSGFSLVTGAVSGLSGLIKLTAIPSLVAMAVPFAPILIAIAAIGAAVLLLKLAWENDWGGIREKLGAVWNFIQPILDNLWGALNMIGSVMETVSPLFKAAWDGIVGIVKSNVNLIIGLINAVIGAWNRLGFTVPSVTLPSIDLPGIGTVGGGTFGGFSFHVPQIPTIPLLDTGGLVRGPGLFGVGPGVTEIVRTPGAMGGIYFAPGAIQVHGNVIGVEDLRREIVSSVREGVQGGGFRGVIPEMPKR